MDHPKPVDLENEGLAGLIDLVSNYRFLILGVFLFGTLAACLVAIMLPVQWQASATLVPCSMLSGQTNSTGLGVLASAASGMGLNVGGGRESLSSLFPYIVKSRQLGLQVLAQDFPDSDNQIKTLLDRLVPADKDSLTRQKEALRKFQKRLLCRLDQKSGVTTISVRLSDPVLAASVANAVVAELDQFSRRARVSQARQNSVFISQRLERIGGQLEKAEVALKVFRQGNSRLNNSPQLRMEESRLARDVQLQTELFISLRSQMELARIEEERNLPLISVIDPAYEPDRQYSPHLARVAVGSGLGFLAFGLILAFFLNFLRFVKSGEGKGTDVPVEES